jgi:uncharacterized protein
MARPRPVRIAVGAAHVSGIWLAPTGTSLCYVFAHAAGAGMTHPFMAAVADGLADRGVATLRYQFPYMEQGGKRPDPPKIAHIAVRAAVAKAKDLGAGMQVFAGGKSFGGRMTSQADAAEALGVAGLVFLGFPLHAAGQPSSERAAHLSDVHVPMLFVQGTRDMLAEHSLMTALVTRLAQRATLFTLTDADHSFHVPARSGRTDTQVREDVLNGVAQWMGKLTGRR